ncbi:MAG: metalloregulator ArsR/SmtB family transcription factor [Elusimicrobiota bacterium]
MDRFKKEYYVKEANILKALSHPTRLLIIDMIQNKEFCVCELQQKIGDDISTVSKHLSVLKNAGLVNTKRKGKWIYYTLTFPCIVNFLRCIKGVVK